MQVHIARTLHDVRNVEPLATDETWEHARRFLGAAPSDPFADHLRWMEDDGKPVACVQVFLHSYAIGQARLGLCLPEYPFVPPELRGRGHFKVLMADLFGWMRRNGYPLAYSHGRKGLYTGIGYAPCFHHGMVLIRVADALRVQAPVRADLATAADMAAHEEEIRRPFPLGRGLQCRDEAWRPEPALVRLVRRAAGGGLTGFAVLGEIVLARRPDGSRSADLRGPAGGKVLLVTDSWAQDVGSAAALLRSVAEEARDLGYTWVLLSCRRDDVLARLSVLAGGELRWSAGQERDWSESGEDVDAFYLADLRLALEQMLPELNARWRECAGSAPAEICLSMEGDEVGVQLGPEVKLLDDPSLSILRVRLPRKAMTQAIVGYACPGELVALHEGCQVPEACSAALDALFVARQPHLVHEGLSFAGPERFGLVP